MIKFLFEYHIEHVINLANVFIIPIIKILNDGIIIIFKMINN